MTTRLAPSFGRKVEKIEPSSNGKASPDAGRGEPGSGKMTKPNGTNGGGTVHLGPNTQINAGWAWGILVAAMMATAFVVTHFHTEPANRKAADAEMRKDFHQLVEGVREELRSIRSELKDVRRDTRDRWPASYMKIWVLQFKTENPNIKIPDIDPILEHGER